jgi:hypothetical protein
MIGILAKSTTPQEVARDRSGIRQNSEQAANNGVHPVFSCNPDATMRT